MTSTHPIQRGQRYKRLIIGLVVVGCLSLFAGIQFGYTFAGVVVYAVAVVAMFAVLGVGQYRDSVEIADEREAELEQRASHLTFQLFGYLGLFAFVGLFLLDASGYREMGATAQTLLNAYAVIALSWGAIYLLLRYRS